MYSATRMYPCKRARGPPLLQEICYLPVDEGNKH